MLQFRIVLFCFIWTVVVVPLTEEHVSRKNLESRIINGRKANLGQFPWQVAILAVHPDGKFRCGGSLINDRKWILTAAHCLNNTQSVKISLGTTHFYKRFYKDPSRIEFSTQDFYIHPKYDKSITMNDIALIEVPSRVKFNEKDKNIQSISLIDKELPSGYKVTTSGWGKIHDEKPYSNDLLYAHMVTISKKGIKTPRHGYLYAEEVQHENICSGDSGGPLVYYNKTTGTHFLVGVASFAADRVTDKPVEKSKLICGHNRPAGFINVCEFMKWIYDVVEHHPDP